MSTYLIKVNDDRSQTAPGFPLGAVLKHLEDQGFVCTIEGLLTPEQATIIPITHEIRREAAWHLQAKTKGNV